MNKIICFIISYFILLNSFSQNINNLIIKIDSIEKLATNCCFFLKKTETFTYQKINEKKFLSINLKKEWDDFNEKFVNDLKYSVSQKIQTSINIVNSSINSQDQQNNQFKISSSYSSKTNITTSIKTLGDFNLDVWPKNFIPKNRDTSINVIGYIKVDKSDLEEKYKNLINSELFRLESDLEVNENDNLNKIIENLGKLIKEINTDILILNTLKKESDYSEIQSNFLSLKKKYASLIEQKIGKDFEKNYLIAKKKLENNDCYEAYNLLSDLYNFNSTEQKVIDDKNAALYCIEMKLINHLSNYENKNECELALITLDSLTALNNKYNDLYINRKSLLIDGYFKTKFNQIDNIIFSNIDEAKRIFDNIHFFGSIKYNDRYDFYDRLIKQKQKKKLLLKFENSIDLFNFYNASSILLSISKEYVGSENISKIIKKLNLRLDKAIYKYEKKQLLNERPHLYSFKLGIEFLNSIPNFNDFFTYNYKYLPDPTRNLIIPYYSFDLYRKFKIKVLKSSNGRDRSRSNLLGIKIGMLDNSNKFNLLDSIPLIQKDFIQNNYYEIQLSSVFMKFFNFRYGAMITDINNIQSDKFLYTTNFGLKIPFWRLDFNVNLKYISDYKSINLLFLESGIALNINFHKKYNQIDKRQVLINSENSKIK